jgi:hypothetical protein
MDKAELLLALHYLREGQAIRHEVCPEKVCFGSGTIIILPMEMGFDM